MKLNKAQTLAEYALLLAIIVASVIAMQVYVKRGLQARYKKIVDSAGQSVGMTQYEPYYTKSEETIEQDHSTTYNYKTEGRLIRDIGSTIKRDSSITIGLDVEADDDWQ